MTNFTFANGKINNAGNASAENSINFNSGVGSTNVTGVVSITNSQITNTEADGVNITNYTGNISNLVISGNTFTDTGDVSTPGSAVVIGINANSVGSAASLTRADLNNNTITDFRAGAGFVIQANSDAATGTAFMTLGTAGSGTNVINVTGNLMNGGNGGIGNQPDRFITGAVNGTGTGNFNVSNNGTALNPIQNIDGVVIELSAFGPANVSATINNNFINANNAVSSSGIGVGLTTDSFPTTDNGTFTTTISGNTISNTNGQGIFVVANGSGNTGTVNAHILNNTVSAPTTGSYGIQVSSGSTGTDVTVNLEISGNNTTGGLNTGTGTTFPGIGLRKQGTDPAVNTFNIKGMPEASTATPAVENYVNSQNTSASGTFGVGGTALVSATSGFTNDTPGGFLQAASGGVEAATPEAPQWHVAGIGDFNGDGLADALVLRDDGLLGVGTINGDPATDSHVLGQLGAQWHIAGVGDVNNDGTSDILLKNDSGTYQADLIRNNAVAATVDLVLVDGELRAAPAPGPDAPPSDPAPVDPMPVTPPPAEPPVQPASGTVETHLTQAELDGIVSAAIARWSATGLTSRAGRRARST